jgi:hypothetical protein
MPELADLEAPPPRPGFRDELFERAELHERRAARRWRSIAIAAIAAALAAASAAGVMAFESGRQAFTGTYDRTMSCAVSIQGGVPVARLAAHSSYTTVSFGRTYRTVALAGLQDSLGNSLGTIADARQGYGFASNGVCVKAAAVPLTHGKLALYDVFRPGDSGLGSMDNGARCLVGSKIRVRVHAVVRKDLPASGQLSVWTGAKKLRQVAFVDWQPKRVALYMSDDCFA